MSESNQPKVAVDVGLSARASFEAKVSTEIPPQSTGRFLDAITDIFRPFSEARGLKADQIRLQREDVLIAIAQKARNRLQLENQQASPLTNKFLVPFLEKASLEEPDSILIDRWADLLASCSIDPSSAHPRFVQMLSELTAREATLLKRIALNNIEQRPRKNLKIAEVFSPLRILNTVSHFLEQLNRETGKEKISDVMRKVIYFLAEPGVALTEMFLLKIQSHTIVVYKLSDINDYIPPVSKESDGSSIDVLSSLSLLEQHNVVIPHEQFVFIQVSYLCVTSLGVEFLSKCDRDLDQYGLERN